MAAGNAVAALTMWMTLHLAMRDGNVVDGQLIRDRSVNCNSQEMEVTFEFAQPFSGIVYASNFYTAEKCRWEGDGSRRLVVPVPLNANPTGTGPYCGVKVQENTGEFTVMLVVTPMKGLLVDGMTGLNVRCLYNIGDVTLTLPAGPNGAGILISPQTQTGIVTGSGGSPFLQMAIRDGHGINGEIVSSASVGQRITIDVVMQDTAIYDFYVHGCYAHDGTNTPEASISIIDQNGCAVRLARAVDVPTFFTTPVSGGAKHVYVHMYGFQFTTSQLVYFECQVRPCLQECARPQCENGNNTVKSKRSAEDEQLDRTPQRYARQSKTAEGDDALQSNYRLQAVLQIKPQSNDVLPVGRDDPLPSTAEGNA
uniref:ZP domain-containing protein n=1 Tax=Plectus sambesii TaxID=2011161 RepID=A0A914XL84_9BILA